MQLGAYLLVMACSTLTVYRPFGSAAPVRATMSKVPEVLPVQVMLAVGTSMSRWPVSTSPAELDASLYSVYRYLCKSGAECRS